MGTYVFPCISALYCCCVAMPFVDSSAVVICRASAALIEHVDSAPVRVGGHSVVVSGQTGYPVMISSREYSRQEMA